MVRVQQKARGRTTGTSRTSGPPCANGLRLIRALLGDRRSCPRRARRSSRGIAHLASAPGCQDHTISPSVLACARLAQPSRPSQPASTFVTIAKRPSARGGMSRDKHDFRKCEREMFGSQGLTEAFALKTLVNFVVRCDGFCEPPRALDAPVCNSPHPICPTGSRSLCPRCPTRIAAITGS